MCISEIIEYNEKKIKNMPIICKRSTNPKKGRIGFQINK